MMMDLCKRVSVLSTYILFGFVVLLMSGCITGATGSGQEGDDASAYMAPANAPYSAIDFQDIKIPGELKWDRENSMSITTDSFAGGTLKFVGRVEVNSLSDFFVNAMTENQWKLAGSVKYKNIILAFTKPYKTCTITIFEKKYTGNTLVEIYITDDIASRKGLNPMREGSMR